MMEPPMFGDVASKLCVVAVVVSALVLGRRRVGTTLCPDLATKAREAEARANLATASQEEIRRVARESVTSCCWRRARPFAI
jgi:ferredoxin-thioredoxin reductase catalytic subunit